MAAPVEFILFVLLLLLHRLNYVKCDQFAPSDITFYPPSGSQFHMHTSTTVAASISGNMADYMMRQRNLTFHLSVNSYESDAVIRVWKKGGKAHSRVPYPIEISIGRALMNTTSPLNSTANELFVVDMVGIGYAQLVFNVIEQRTTNSTMTLLSQVYQLSSVRKLRAVDIGFNTFITILAVLNMFALGCLTDMDTVKQQLERKAALAAAMVAHYLIVPLVSN